MLRPAHRADARDRNRLRPQRCHHVAGCRWGHAEEQRSRGHQSKRVKTQKTADLAGLRQDRDTGHLDLQTGGRRRRELGQSVEDTALGRVVHGMHRPRRDGGQRCVHDADAGVPQQRRGVVHDRRRQGCGQAGPMFAREDRGAFDGDTVGEQQVVACLQVRLSDQLCRRDLPEHVAHDHRGVHTRCDFGMPAADRHIEHGAGVPDVGHDRLDQLGRRAVG